MEELSLSSPITSPGKYQAVFQWKDLLVYDLGNINRSINVNFESPASNMNSGGPDFPHANYYYHDSYSSGFSFFVSFLIISSVFVFVMYVVFKNQKNYKQSYTRGSYSNTHARDQKYNMTRPLIPSFCSNCGAHMPANGEYCPDCGTKLDWD